VPHVIVKLYSGRPDREKSRLADEITRAVMSALKYDEESVSVGIEDVKPEDWAEKVYTPDILNKLETIYKKPGYDPT
jgi:4-oxalocrotonate tautomerase